MELILQQGLVHQQRAIDAVCDALEGVRIAEPVQYYENPSISLSDPMLYNNLRRIQLGVPAAYRSKEPVGDCLNLDVKMETGTGKTYVYTKTIFELHKRYGFNKFIIAVPSLAIKAGAAQFLQDEYARRHFKDGCGYDAEMDVGVLESPKSKKKGRSYFPSQVSDFVKGSCQNQRKIYVLLVNMHLLGMKKNGMLSRDDYGYGAEGFYCPLDALCATKPVVIIDEPHRFSRDQKAFQVIAEEIQPQCIIRYGATFPEIVSGRGKNKTGVRDYQNLLYDLNACDSFNQGLIKGVAKEHFDPPSRQNEKVKILSIKPKESVTFQRTKGEDSGISIPLHIGDSMAMVSEAFEGVTIQEISQNEVVFSNGVRKSAGMVMDVDIYMTSYQEEMLRLALQRHFETEKENFCGRVYKIKTLALFFIDDIASYRPDADGKIPYLLTAFERLLKERIELTIQSLNEQDAQYREFLEASLENLSACHAGYFSQDNSDSDEEIGRQVDAILHGKKQLLSFRNADGSYNTLRFLFSKWTLKEGWDNPNVFTIAKLRSSGSENSKLQEVGRGLRLPVDENGNRISNEEFLLNYIVDFTEADFAQRLVDQINGEIPQASQITGENLERVARKLGKDPDELFAQLLTQHYVDWKRTIIPENRSAFLDAYPDFGTGLSSGKIRDRNKDNCKSVKIRKAVYCELKELWERINQRYLLFYDSDLNRNLDAVVLSLLEKNVFADVVMMSRRDVVGSDGTRMQTAAGTGVQYTISRPIPYGQFLKRITRTTNLPVSVLHSAMNAYVKAHGTIDPRYINENSVSAFCGKFQEWKLENLQGRFHYVKSSTQTGATALTYPDGTPREEIAQGRIGTRLAPGKPSDKYLYDACAYDSPLEKDNLMTEIEEVVVYGKIPRSSIAIPTITGGMYSPDFMYVVKKSDGEKVLNIVVETKDVEDGTALRGNEAARIRCAEVFFENLNKEGYTVRFCRQLNNSQMAQIIHEVLD